MKKYHCKKISGPNALVCSIHQRMTAHFLAVAWPQNITRPSYDRIRLNGPMEMMRTTDRIREGGDRTGVQPEKSTIFLRAVPCCRSMAGCHNQHMAVNAYAQRMAILLRPTRSRLLITAEFLHCIESFNYCIQTQYFHSLM